MKFLIVPAGFFILLETYLFAFSGQVWFLACVPLWALLSCAFLFRRISLVALGCLLALFPASFLLFSPDALPSQGIVVLASALFAFFVVSAKSGALQFAVTAAFAGYLSFLLFVLVFTSLVHVPVIAVLAAIGLVSMLWFFASQTAMLELGFWLKVRLILFSAVVGLLLAEVYWLLSKLPIHALNVDILIGILYYTLWDIAQRYFSLRFTIRALFEDCAVCAAGVALVLLTAHWFPS